MMTRMLDLSDSIWCTLHGDFDPAVDSSEKSIKPSLVLTYVNRRECEL